RRLNSKAVSSFGRPEGRPSPKANGADTPSCRTMVAAAELLLLLQLQRRRVHAIAQTGRLRPIGKNVPEMAAAFRAKNLGPRHAEFAIGFRFHGIFLHRFVEARPTTARLVFCLRAEERVPAGSASIHARVMRVGVFPG